MNVISIRVPKTASSTFGDILEQIYQQDYPGFLFPIRITIHDYSDPIYNPDKSFLKGWREGMDICLPAFQNLSYIHVHKPLFLFDGYFPEAKRIIWLREPVRRQISGYYFAKALEHIPKDMSIWEYVKLPPQNNMMTYLSGGDLSKFYFVGISDQFGLDIYKLSKLMGWPEFTIPQLNVAVDPAYITARNELLLNNNFIRHVQSSCKDDCNLYREAIKRQHEYRH